jgi:hypothetical protein
VHFTKAGAEKLGRCTEHNLRRALIREVPVAALGSEEPPPCVEWGALGVRQLVSAMAEGANRQYYLKRQ